MSCIHLFVLLAFSASLVCVSFGFSFQQQKTRQYWRGIIRSITTKQKQQQNVRNYNLPMPPLSLNTLTEGNTTSSSEHESTNQKFIKSKRKVKITAVPVDTGTLLLPDDDDNTKIIHFQRHGQGVHNVIERSWKEVPGNVMDKDSKDPKFNPSLSKDLVDSPLTEVGIQQCIDQQLELKKIGLSNLFLDPKLIIVSPLQRAIQSAELTWNTFKCLDSKESSDKVIVPWIAHEGCRESLGLYQYNKRRPKSVIREEYPNIDFSLLTNEEDVLFLEDRRESDTEKSNRGYNFMTNFVRNLPQNEIAIVCHSGWLFNMCNVVMDIQDEQLKTKFVTSGIRSMKVIFTDNKQK